ncbi:MAG TPA: sulfotransferase [Candidatus Elarobacter sp.]|nr:sulfotransferase [Candidatus Elarobacter sp.]
MDARAHEDAFAAARVKRGAGGVNAVCYDVAQLGLGVRPDDTDHVMIRIESPALEQSARRASAEVELRLEIGVGARYADFRIAGQAYRRHQFLVPIHELRAARGIVRLSLTPVKWDAPELPALSVAASYCNKEHLIGELEQRMIWIFGSARAGTTWLLRDILGAVPSRSRIEDDAGVRPIDETGLGFLLGAVELDAERFYALHRIEPGANGSLELAASPFERLITRRSGKAEFLANPRTTHVMKSAIREIVFNHVLVHWGLLDYDYVALKAPNEGHAADLLMSALPAARMLVIMRDGRDALRSRFTPFASRTLAETSDAGLRRYAVAYYSHLWNFQTEIVDRAFDAHDPSRRLRVRYEHLRQGSFDAFRSLYRFVDAGLSEPAVRAVMERVRLENVPHDQRGPHLPQRSGEIGGYRRYFTREEVLLMTRIMATTLRMHGYDASLTGEGRRSVAGAVPLPSAG